MKSNVEVLICKPESADMPYIKSESGVSPAYPSHSPTLPHSMRNMALKPFNQRNSQLFYLIHTVLAQSHPHL